MNFIILLLIVACIFGGLFFSYKKLFGGRREVERVLKEDPAAQEEYQHAKHQEEEKEKTLTLEERIELSWEFLTNITEQVMNKFSKQDQEQVHEAGSKLAEYGMSYQHDVKQEIKQNVSKVKSIAKNQEKATAQGKGGRGA